MYITLEQIKKHLNIDSYFNDDDEYLATLYEVALNTVEKHIDEKIENIVCCNDGDIPAPLKHAMLLLIAHLYNSREAVTYTSATEVPVAYNYLLDLYKNYDIKTIDYTLNKR